MMLYLALYPETIVREEHDDAILICLYTDYNCFCTVVSSPMICHDNHNRPPNTILKCHDNHNRPPNTTLICHNNHNRPPNTILICHYNTWHLDIKLCSNKQRNVPNKKETYH